RPPPDPPRRLRPPRPLELGPPARRAHPAARRGLRRPLRPPSLGLHLPRLHDPLPARGARGQPAGGRSAHDSGAAPLPRRAPPPPRDRRRADGGDLLPLLARGAAAPPGAEPRPGAGLRSVARELRHAVRTEPRRGRPPGPSPARRERPLPRL